jgi:hypothetical protein
MCVALLSVSSSLNSIQVDLNCGEVWNLYEAVLLSLMSKPGLVAEGDSDIQHFSITMKHLSRVPILQGTLTAIQDWFRDYKIPDGKPANKFGLGDKAADKEYALKVIAETNEAWAKLVKRSVPAGELSLV